MQQVAALPGLTTNPSDKAPLQARPAAVQSGTIKPHMKATHRLGTQTPSVLPVLLKAPDMTHKHIECASCSHNFHTCCSDKAHALQERQHVRLQLLQGLLQPPPHMAAYPMRS